MNDETFTVPTISYTQEQELFDKIHRYSTNIILVFETSHNHSRQKTCLLSWAYVLLDKTNLCLYLPQICLMIYDLYDMYCCFQPSFHLFGPILYLELLAHDVAVC